MPFLLDFFLFFFMVFIFFFFFFARYVDGYGNRTSTCPFITADRAALKQLNMKVYPGQSRSALLRLLDRSKILRDSAARCGLKASDLRGRARWWE